MAALRSIADLPGPSRLPLLGNTLQLRNSSPHLTIEGWCERYGPIFRFAVGSRLMVAIADLTEINEILRDRPDGFRRWRERKQVFHELGIDAIFPAEGEDWRRQRRMAVTALNSHHLQRYFHVVRTATERLHSRVADVARDGHTFDISEELSSFAIDVTCALAFGRDPNTLERRDGEIHGHIQRLFEMLARPALLAPSAPASRSCAGPFARGAARHDQRVRAGSS
jgi:cytochrome P450